ncbi:tetratricopeptide repeat-containing sensor histidine kinase [Pleomorphovibrio marinus]|uniref:tetratricopeptide repeat-containing sensor histidine kinase n=1 Tax=Pleomorphovibrio marinus TaxID=2164132 RepID=UPI0018E588A8|nr:tetratricopeptide repeat-containing sensor histidine kinase [Pleomorphovibrio marinus]
MENKIALHLEKAEAYQYEDRDSALLHIEHAEILAQESNSPYWKAWVQNRRGAVYYILGDYDVALESFVDAQRVFEDLNDQSGWVFAMNGRGLVFLGQKEYEEAIKTWDKCLEINRTLGDSISMARNMFNLGISYCELQEYDESLSLLTNALKLLETDPQNVLNLMVKNRMAQVHFHKNQLETAVRLYQEVLSATHSLNNWEKTYAYTGLAEIAALHQDWEKAKSYGEKGYETAILVGAHWDLERATGVLASAHEMLEEFPNALHFTKINKAYGDSLYNTEKDKQIDRLQLKLAQAENETLLAEQQAAMQQSKRKSYGLILSFVLSALLGTFILTYHKNLKIKEKLNKELLEKNRTIKNQHEKIQKHNQGLQEINETKNKLFSILSHDLRSPLHSIIQLIEMYLEGYFKEEDKEDALRMLYEQVKKTESMLDGLLNWANQQLDSLEARPMAFQSTEVIENLIDLYDYQTQSKKLKISHESKPLPPIWADKGQFQIIIQNLFHNAIKFTPNEGEIKIYYKQDSSMIHLHIKDSGEGMDEESRKNFLSDAVGGRMVSQIGTNNEKGTGLGLLLVKQFVLNNQGIIQIQSQPNKGTEFILSFKKAYTEN